MSNIEPINVDYLYKLAKQNYREQVDQEMVAVARSAPFICANGLDVTPSLDAARASMSAIGDVLFNTFPEGLERSRPNRLEDGNWEDVQEEEINKALEVLNASGAVNAVCRNPRSKSPTIEVTYECRPSAVAGEVNISVDPSE